MKKRYLCSVKRNIVINKQKETKMEKKISMFRKAMANGVVCFKYMKKDGTIREAKGTTNPKTVSANYVVKGGVGPSKAGYISYWDMDKNNWRCFDPDKLVSAEGIF